MHRTSPNVATRMKTFHHSVVVSLLVLLFVASAAYAGSISPMDLTVSNSAGKVVYKGKTNAQGAFSTPTLAPGNYVVLFNSKKSPKGGPFSAVVGVGKEQAIANAIPGGKFAQGGVAMKVKVEAASGLTGQLSEGRQAAEAAAPAPTPAAKTGDNRKVKYVNGKKYVWIDSGIAASFSGRWVPADSPEAQNSGR